MHPLAIQHHRLAGGKVSAWRQTEALRRRGGQEVGAGAEGVKGLDQATCWNGGNLTWWRVVDADVVVVVTGDGLQVRRARTTT